MNEKNTPTKPGLYLAKSYPNYTWWDLLVYIYGTPPYLNWNTWAYFRRELNEMNLRYMYFGPKIADCPDEMIVPLDNSSPQA